MSLLTPSESRAFQSFLDSTAFPTDWNMQLEISHEHMPPAHGTEALTKATRDLMSLDGEKWRYPLGAYSAGESSVTSAHRQPPLQPNPHSVLYSNHFHRSLGISADGTERGTRSGAPNSRSQAPRSPFYQTINSTADSTRGRSYDRGSSSSSQSSIDPLASSSSSTHAPNLPAAKRSPPPDVKLSNKRHRSSAASQEPSEEAQTQLPNRVTLLSPSQKKANHIQSEQKRRANIRRGYDALCEIVPALREACLAEDEQLANGKAKNRRRAKGKEKDDSERIDGRSGPRSENVVLSKTIERVHELLAEREVLMQRLHVARSALPVDDPLLCPQLDAPAPLWERKWTGGEKKEGDEDDDDDDDE